MSITSDPISPIIEGTNVTLACTVELSPSVMESDLSLLMVDTQLSRDGTPLTLTGPTVAGTTFTYTIQLDSFGRSNSGNYTCTVTVRPQPLSLYINMSSTLSHTVRVTTGKINSSIHKVKCLQLDSVGVYISLRGKIYSNNSNILVTDIGERGNGSLLCFTDLFQCCKKDQTSNDTALGEWYYPNGLAVGVLNGSAVGFYKNGDCSRVRLHRRKNVTSPIGYYCCEVPDATLTHVRICVYLGELIIINF